MSEYIRIENLTVGYGNKEVVSNVNLSINKGEIISLIGSNGSGKSTLLRTIAGLQKELSGSIYIDGKRMVDIPKKDLAKEIAVLFPEKKIVEKITCFDLASLGRYPYTGLFGKLTKEDEEIVIKCMEQTETLDLMNCDINEISDGQRQRVFLARALCQEPNILILDEPTSFLDIKYKIDFLDIISKLSKREDITIIMSLHEIEMVKKISDRVVTIKNNRVEKIGKSEEVFAGNYINELFNISEDKLWLL